MSRTLSLAARRAITAPETDEVFLLLLTLSAADLTEPIRVVNDRRNLVSREQTFVGYPFEIDLPAEDPESVARVTLRIDNVDRLIVEKLRTLQEPLAVALEVVRAADPDTLEAGPFAMTLVTAEYDALTITGELAFEDVLNEPFPGHAYVPSDYPGLF